MKTPEYPERPPLNNLDLFDHRPAPQSAEELFDEIPYEPTLEEKYADYTYEQLGDLAFKSFFDDGINTYSNSLPTSREAEYRDDLTPEERLVLGSARLILSVLMREHKSRVNPDSQMSDRIQNANLYAVAKAGKHDGQGSLLYDFIQPHFRQIYRSEDGGMPTINHGPIVRIKDQGRSQDYRRVEMLHRICHRRYGEFVEIDGIVELIDGVTPEMIAKYKELHKEHVSLALDGPEEQILDEDPCVNPGMQNDYSGLRRALEILGKKQRRTIELYFGLNGDEPMGLREISEKEGLSHQGVSARLNAGLRLLASMPDIRDIIDGVVEPETPKETKGPKAINNSQRVQKVIDELNGPDGLMRELKSHRVSAKSIAEELSISSVYLSHMLNGRNPIKPDMLTKLLSTVDDQCKQKLGMTLQEFMQSNDVDGKGIAEYLAQSKPDSKL